MASNAVQGYEKRQIVTVMVPTQPVVKYAFDEFPPLWPHQLRLNPRVRSMGFSRL